MVAVEFCMSFKGVSSDQSMTKGNMDERLSNTSLPLAGVSMVLSVFIKNILKIEFLSFFILQKATAPPATIELKL
jgi:hypothetical protein